MALDFFILSYSDKIFIYSLIFIFTSYIVYCILTSYIIDKNT